MSSHFPTILFSHHPLTPIFYQSATHTFHLCPDCLRAHEARFCSGRTSIDHEICERHAAVCTKENRLYDPSDLTFFRSALLDGTLKKEALFHVNPHGRQPENVAPLKRRFEFQHSYPTAQSDSASTHHNSKVDESDRDTGATGTNPAESSFKSASSFTSSSTSASLKPVIASMSKSPSSTSSSCSTHKSHNRSFITSPVSQNSTKSSNSFQTPLKNGFIVNAAFPVSNIRYEHDPEQGCIYSISPETVVLPTVVSAKLTDLKQQKLSQLKESDVHIEMQGDLKDQDEGQGLYQHQDHIHCLHRSDEESLESSSDHASDSDQEPTQEQIHLRYLQRLHQDLLRGQNQALQQDLRFRITRLSQDLSTSRLTRGMFMKRCNGEYVNAIGDSLGAITRLDGNTDLISSVDGGVGVDSNRTSNKFETLRQPEEMVQACWRKIREEMIECAVEQVQASVRQRRTVEQCYGSIKRIGSTQLDGHTQCNGNAGDNGVRISFGHIDNGCRAIATMQHNRPVRFSLQPEANGDGNGSTKAIHFHIPETRAQMKPKTLASLVDSENVTDSTKPKLNTKATISDKHDGSRQSETYNRNQNTLSNIFPLKPRNHFHHNRVTITSNTHGERHGIKREFDTETETYPTTGVPRTPMSSPILTPIYHAGEDLKTRDTLESPETKTYSKNVPWLNTQMDTQTKQTLIAFDHSQSRPEGNTQTNTHSNPRFTTNARFSMNTNSKTNVNCSKATQPHTQTQPSKSSASARAAPSSSPTSTQAAVAQQPRIPLKILIARESLIHHGILPPDDLIVICWAMNSQAPVPTPTSTTTPTATQRTS